LVVAVHGAKVKWLDGLNQLNKASAEGHLHGSEILRAISGAAML
jgi:hypothetical protein